MKKDYKKRYRILTISSLESGHSVEKMEEFAQRMKKENDMDAYEGTLDGIKEWKSKQIK